MPSPWVSMHIPTREISVQQIPILAEYRAFLASGSDPPTQLMRIEGLIYVHKVVSRGVSTLLGLTVRLHKLLVGQLLQSVNLLKDEARAPTPGGPQCDE